VLLEINNVLGKYSLLGNINMELLLVQVKWVPVSTAWRDLWLQEDEGSPDMEESWE